MSTASPSKTQKLVAYHIDLAVSNVTRRATSHAYDIDGNAILNDGKALLDEEVTGAFRGGLERQFFERGLRKALSAPRHPERPNLRLLRSRKIGNSASSADGPPSALGSQPIVVCIDV